MFICTRPRLSHQIQIWGECPIFKSFVSYFIITPLRPYSLYFCLRESLIKIRIFSFCQLCFNKSHTQASELCYKNQIFLLLCLQELTFSSFLSPSQIKASKYKTQNHSLYHFITYFQF